MRYVSTGTVMIDTIKTISCWVSSCILLVAHTFGSFSVFQVPLRAEEITIPADVTPERVPTHIVDYSGKPSPYYTHTYTHEWYELGLVTCTFLYWCAFSTHFRGRTVRRAAVPRNIKGWFDSASPSSALTISAPSLFPVHVKLIFLFISTGKRYLHSLLGQQQEVHWKGEHGFSLLLS